MFSHYSSIGSDDRRTSTEGALLIFIELISFLFVPFVYLSKKVSFSEHLIRLNRFCAIDTCRWLLKWMMNGIDTFIEGKWKMKMHIDDDDCFDDYTAMMSCTYEWIGYWVVLMTHKHIIQRGGMKKIKWYYNI